MRRIIKNDLEDFLDWLFERIDEGFDNFKILFNAGIWIVFIPIWFPLYLYWKFFSNKEN